MNALAIQRRARSLHEQARCCRADLNNQHSVQERNMILASLVSLKSRLLLNAEADAASLLESVIADFKMQF